jgi:hypothetical protein
MVSDIARGHKEEALAAEAAAKGCASLRRKARLRGLLDTDADANANANADYRNNTLNTSMPQPSEVARFNSPRAVSDCEGCAHASAGGC